MSTAATPVPPAASAAAKESFWQHVVSFFKIAEQDVASVLKKAFGTAGGQAVLAAAQSIASTALGGIALGVVQNLGKVEAGTESFTTALKQIASAASAAGIEAEQSSIQLALSSAITLVNNATAQVTGSTAAPAAPAAEPQAGG
jgi:hypothetical protein